MDKTKIDIIKTYVMNKNIHSRAAMIITYYNGDKDEYETAGEAMPVFTYRIHECKQVLLKTHSNRDDAVKYHYELVDKAQSVQTGEPGVMRFA